MSFVHACQASPFLRLPCRGANLRWAFLTAIVLGTVSPAFAQPAPPEPSDTYAIGDTIINPIMGLTTTVTASPVGLTLSAGQGSKCATGNADEPRPNAGRTLGERWANAPLPRLIASSTEVFLLPGSQSLDRFPFTF